MKAESETTPKELGAPQEVEMSVEMEERVQRLRENTIAKMKNHVPDPRPPLRQPEAQADRWIRHADQAAKQQSD